MTIPFFLDKYIYFYREYKEYNTQIKIGTSKTEEIANMLYRYNVLKI